MARYAGDPGADQRSGHSGSQQAGSHRLVRSIKRPRLSRTSKHCGCLTRCGKDAFGLEALIALPLYRTTTTTKSFHQGLHRIAKTNEQFPNGVLATCSRKWPSMTVPFSNYEFPGRSYFVSLKSNRTLPPRWECSTAPLIWDGLYVVVIGKLNLPEATTFVASVSAARILGRYSS